MINQIISPVQLNVNSDEELIVTTKKKYLHRPRFMMVSQEDKRNNMVDALELVANMDSDEKFCFFTIKKAMYYDYEKEMMEYIVKVPKFDKQSKANMFNRGFKKLKEKDVIKRVKRGYYMLNPNILIPANYEYWNTVWKGIK